MADRITVIGWGTSAVWDSYARVGLFAYDWDEQRHRYLRVAQPTQALSTDISVLLAARPLPRLALSFRTSPNITADDV